MKQRVRVQKTEAAAGDAADSTPTNRLTGISVNEVSIVDHAANKRKYLVVKEDKTAAAPPPPSGTPAAPAAPAAPPTAPAQPATPQLKISPEFKAKVAGVLSAASAKIAVISKALETAAETPGAPPPQELMDALTGLSGLFASAPAAPAPPAPPTPPAAPQAKAGRKISAERLKLIADAKSALDKVIADVTEADDDDADGDKPAKTEKNDPTPAGDPATPPVAAAPDLSGIIASVEQLAATVGKMTQVFEGQNQRLDKLAKARGESRQVDLDKQTEPRGGQKVVWAMDMAAPVKNVQ